MSDKLEMFTGLQIKYPEYDVIVPQTLNKFTIRSLTVSEEENLKASFLNPRTIPVHATKIIWDCLVKKPKDIETYEQFVNKITTFDRDTLLYALYHISYKEIHDFSISCNNCDNQYSVRVNISKTFNILPYKGKANEILNKTSVKKLEIASNVSFEVCQPTLTMEKELLEDPMFFSEDNLKIGVEILPIKKISIYDATSDKTQEITTRENIFLAYKSLPASDRRLITKEYQTEFGQYRTKLIMTSRCPKCDNQNDNSIDLMQSLFRLVFE